jgi:hypothetical protein
MDEKMDRYEMGIDQIDTCKAEVEDNRMGVGSNPGRRRWDDLDLGVVELLLPVVKLEVSESRICDGENTISGADFIITIFGALCKMLLNNKSKY